MNDAQDRFFKPKVYEELYNIAEDPDQMTNLIGQPRHIGTVRQLRRVLDGHMLENRDAVFIPEGAPTEGFAHTQDREAYPLKAIMMLAQSAARGDRKKAGLFARELSNSDGIVRYWAATGLLIIGDAARPHIATLQKAASADPWPSVRVVAAEALCRHTGVDEGLQTLSTIAGDTTLPFPPRLQALNA